MPYNIPRSSYYDKYSQGTASSLARARRPFLVKNALTGLGIFSLAIGIYAYTIHAIAQDDFEDIPIPDPPSPPPQVANAVNAGANPGSAGGRPQ